MGLLVVWQMAPHVGTLAWSQTKQANLVALSVGLMLMPDDSVPTMRTLPMRKIFDETR